LGKKGGRGRLGVFWKRGYGVLCFKKGPVCGVGKRGDDWSLSSLTGRNWWLHYPKEGKKRRNRRMLGGGKSCRGEGVFGLLCEKKKGWYGAFRGNKWIPDFRRS